MINIKKTILGVAISASAFGALALPSLAVSDNANQNACFGQARATYATTNAPGSVGDAASSRKGDNAAMNAAYRDACQAQLVY